tara:strand:+ start:680 stop:1006 length:327 start_codon:yes stop_codon:yes gene_type:complete
MDINTTRPIKEIDKIEFKNILANKEKHVSFHAFDHLSERQRKVFKEEELISMLLRETPRKIYLQHNGRYAVYYRKSDGYRKLILEISDKKITIVTFINVLEIPRYKNE